MGGRWWRWALVAVISCSFWLGDVPWRMEGAEAEAALRKLKSGIKRGGGGSRKRRPRPNLSGNRDAYVHPVAKQEYELGKEKSIKSQGRGNSKVNRGKGKAKGKRSRAKHYRR